MKMRLAGLRFFIRGRINTHILPGVGSRCHSFFFCFVGLDLNDAPHYVKWNKYPGRCLWLDQGVTYLFTSNGEPANRKWR